jgi:hypothetical protein
VSVRLQAVCHLWYAVGTGWLRWVAHLIFTSDTRTRLQFRCITESWIQAGGGVGVSRSRNERQAHHTHITVRGCDLWAWNTQIGFMVWVRDASVLLRHY